MNRRTQAGRPREEGAEPRPDVACRHFQRGHCFYGDKCAFKHVLVSELEPRRPVERAPVDARLEAVQSEFRSVEAALNTLRRQGMPSAGLMPLVTELKMLQAEAHALRGPGKPQSRFATRPRLRNSERAGALRRFLIDQWGLEALRQGVIDVAGGQGALAFELANLNDVPVTVVDPRPMDLKRLVFKWKRGLYFRTEPLQRYNGNQASAETANARAVHAEWQAAAGAAAAAAQQAAPGVAPGATHKRPAHWRICWEPSLWGAALMGTAAGDERPSPLSLERELARLQMEAAAMRWTKKGLVQLGWDDGDGGGGQEAAAMEEEEEEEAEAEAEAETEADTRPDSALQQQIDEEEKARARAGGGDGGDGSTLTADEVRRVLASSAAVVGMHPDGATEAIVDFALEHGKLFACVPCCVYSAAFPLRRDARGRRVTQYNAFIDYLVAKAPGRIGVATLPFEGKNKVVYSLPRPEEACQPCDDEGEPSGG